jgi:hypothetical protein
MVTDVVRTDRRVRVRVFISPAVLDQYQQQADRVGLDVETLLGDRLGACVEHTAGKPLYFNDAERQEIDKMFGKNVYGTRDLLNQVRNCLAVKVGNIKITLQAPLLSRLKSRCLGAKWEAFLERLIIEDLERYCGLR